MIDADLVYVGHERRKSNRVTAITVVVENPDHSNAAAACWAPGRVDVASALEGFATDARITRQIRARVTARMLTDLAT